MKRCDHVSLDQFQGFRMKQRSRKSGDGKWIWMISARQGEPPAKDPPNSQAYIQTYTQAYIQIKADTYLQAILTKTKQTHTQQRPPNSTPQNKTAKKYYLI